MKLPTYYLNFNASAALQKSKLLPIMTADNEHPLTCSNCSFINRKSYNFCTNCGFPVFPDKDLISLYFFRLQKRQKLQRNCSVKIEQARNALYVVAFCSMLGIFYVFSDVKSRVISGLVMVLLGIIYAGLGRWSLQKPFTALLISLIIMMTFAVINAMAEFSSMYGSASGLYILMVQFILIYFLLRGVKGAFHADILEEEFKL